MVIPVTGTLRTKQYVVTLVVLVCTIAASVAVAQAQTTAEPTVGLQNGSLTFNGSPFFPIMAYSRNPCPDKDSIDKFVSVGTSIIAHFEGTCSGDYTQQLHDALTGRSTGTVWWHERDEAASQQLSGLPQLLDWQASVSFVDDASSLIGCGSHGSIGQYNAVRAKAKASQAVIATVQLGSPPTQDSRICITPAGVKNLVFTAVVAKAKGILWATINPLNASTSDFSVRQDVIDAALLASKQLAVLRPVILNGTYVKMALNPQSSVRASAWKYRGVYYVIAVNTEKASATARMSVPVGNTKVQVLWEGRIRKVSQGRFGDSFAGLAVHVYKMTPVKKWPKAI